MPKHFRKRPYTAEGNQDLAEYLGVREPHNAESGAEENQRRQTLGDTRENGAEDKVRKQGEGEEVSVL